MTPEERQAAIEQIRLLPSALHSAVAGLDDRQIDTPYRDGGWTIRQVIHHLADSHMNAFIRMKLILTEDHPTLKPYKQETWAMQQDSLEPPVALSLAILEGLHGRWTGLLKNVKDADWTRTAYHPESGEVTLEGVLRTYANHGAKHIGHITGLRSRMGW